MSENIYEISKAIDNNMKNDFNEISALINNYFKNKYIDKLKNGISAHQLRLSEKPSKEIQLLNSLKLFISEDKKENLENVINAITIFNTFSSIANEYTENKLKNNVKIATLNNSEDNSIKSDGVYDIDENCMHTLYNSNIPLQNIVLLLAMAGVF